MKKLVCLILALCSLIALVACNTSNTADSETADIETQTIVGSDTSDVVSEGVIIVKDGAPVFTVVYSDASYEDIATSLCSALKQKTNVEFKSLRFAPNDGKSCMYVGYDYEKLGIDGERVSTNGYAVVEKDGNIYFCGKNTSTVGEAVETFLSTIVPKNHVTTDETGKTVLAIVPQKAFVLFNPDYIVSDPTLLGEHIDNYRIVISKDADAVRKLQANIICKQIASLTGFELKIVTDDTSAAEREIVIGNTTRKTLDALDNEINYSIKGNETRVFLNFGSDYAFDALCEKIRAMFGQESIDISGSSTLDYYKREGDIRIISYNAWASTPEGYLPAEKNAGLAAFISELAPDFVGLQEAGNWRSAVSNLLSDEYGVISQTTGHTPIFYRKDTWQPAKDAEDNVIKNSLTFARVGVWGYEWVMFEKIDDPTVKVIVGNLHFCNTNEDIEWNYRKERPEQMKAFNDEIKRLETEYAGIPMFFTGDYNTTTTMTGNDTYADGWENIVGGTSLTTGMALTEDTNAYNAIDHVCTNGELVDVIRHRRVSYKVMKDLSDHTPVFIDVKLK